MESALVYGIRPGGLLVFVPAYHLRSAVQLTDRRGAVIAPLASDDDDDSTDAFARAARRSLRLAEGALLCACSPSMQHTPWSCTGASLTTWAAHLQGFAWHDMLCRAKSCPPILHEQQFRSLSCNTVDMGISLMRKVALRAGKDHVRIVEDDTGMVLLDVRPMQRAWVRLGAQASRSHGPTLRIQLLAPGHPDAVKAATEAAQSRPQHQTNPVRELLWSGPLPASGSWFEETSACGCKYFASWQFDSPAFDGSLSACPCRAGHAFAATASIPPTWRGEAGESTGHRPCGAQPIADCASVDRCSQPCMQWLIQLRSSFINPH